MRQAALFVKLHRLQIKDNNLQFNETKVLVTEDGKRAKRWCLLNDGTISSILAGLTRLSRNKPTTFFPSGELVAHYRELKNYIINGGIEISIAQLSEANPSSNNGLPEKNTTVTSQPTKLSHLDRLEAESPVMLYSAGKDYAVMLHLARKAFYTSPPTCSGLS